MFRLERNRDLFLPGAARFDAAALSPDLSAMPEGGGMTGALIFLSLIVAGVLILTLWSCLVISARTDDLASLLHGLATSQTVGERD